MKARGAERRGDESTEEVLSRGGGGGMEGQEDWRGEERRGGVKLSGAAGRRRGEGLKWRAGGIMGGKKMSRGQSTAIS